MSRKGDCWDNAVAESFFKTLNTELVYHQDYETRKQAELAVFDYIETWYNRQRRHSALNGMTILEFEKLNYKKTSSLTYLNQFVQFFVGIPLSDNDGI